MPFIRIQVVSILTPMGCHMDSHITEIVDYCPSHNLNEHEAILHDAVCDIIKMTIVTS